jgi:hypothetical protein
MLQIIFQNLRNIFFVYITLYVKHRYFSTKIHNYILKNVRYTYIT